jgi:hypothetical protein
MMLERGVKVDHTTFIDGFKLMLLNWTSTFGLISAPPMTRGKLMKPTSKLKGHGSISTAPLIPRGIP